MKIYNTLSKAKEEFIHREMDKYCPLFGWRRLLTRNERSNNDKV